MMIGKNMFLNSLTSLYYDWLRDRIDMQGDAERYSQLINQMFHTQYDFFVVANDYNRSCDGVDLRPLFLQEVDLPKNITDEDLHIWRTVECSFLELLIGLADRLSYLSYRSTPEAFWEIITNMGLMDYCDDSYDRDDVIFILERFMHREYEKDGTDGGIFPIPGTHVNMLKTELLMQLYIYLKYN